MVRPREGPDNAALIPMESAQDRLFSKMPGHQHEMMAEYGLAAPLSVLVYC